VVKKKLWSAAALGCAFLVFGPGLTDRFQASLFLQAFTFIVQRENQALLGSAA
jgi:hypothetical protein